MKVVSAKEMANAEAIGYHQGCAEKDFMENAGRGVACAIHTYIQEMKIPPIVWILCGKGNNGGDAFVAGRYLLQMGCKVSAIHNENLERCSSLCRENRTLFLEKGGSLLQTLSAIGSSGIILDGIFGTGFKGKVEEPYSTLIETANNSGLPIIALDIPSGLNGTTGQTEGSVIHATLTLYLGLPKTGFFLGNGWNVVGKLQKVDFGLPAESYENVKGEFELMTKKRAFLFSLESSEIGINIKQAM